MGLSTFLAALFEHGRTPVDSLANTLTTDELCSASEILAAAEETCRANFPGIAPSWNALAGLWAARQFYLAAQLAVQREVDIDSRSADLKAACLVPVSASSCYSVDLVFQYLPDLYLLARRAASEDPLLAILDGWAQDWPLSSVGVRVAEPRSFEHLLGPELLPFYAERIISRKDVSRLTHPLVCEEVRKQLGLHKHLAPELWNALATG
jgi:hypothetical protein